MKQTLCLLPVLAACAALAAPEYRNLPPAYVQVEYIRSTGAQYIDTGVAAGPDVSAVLDFIPLEYTGNVSLGTQPGDDNRDWRFFNYNGGSMFDVGSQRIGMNSSTVLSNGTRYTISIGNAYLTIYDEDGGVKWHGTGATMETGNIIAANIFLGANNNGSGAASLVRQTVYSLTMSSTADGVTTLTRDFVPCVRASDGEPGLYDLVSHTFFANPAQSAAKFEVGDVVECPADVLAALGGLDLSAWRATFTVVASKIGDAATSGDLYFAYAAGTDATALTPALVQSGLAAEESATIDLTGLAPATEYAYAFYLKNDLGQVSSTVTGTFTTAALEPVVPSVAYRYASVSDALLMGVITDFGEEGSDATFYFACGPDGSELVPAAYTNGLALGTAFDIPLPNLQPGVAYTYAYYAANDLGQASETFTGTFSTPNGSVPRWIGRVSSKWSDDDNWDTGVAPAAGSTYNQIILEQPSGCFPPANLDIAGLSIDTISFGTNSVGNFTVSGEPFAFRRLANENGTAYSVTFNNDITFIGQGRSSLVSGMSAVFRGAITGSQGFYIDNYGGISFLGANPDFQGNVTAHVGTFTCTGEESLGIPPEEPDVEALRENWGTLNFIGKEDGRHLHVIELNPNRGIYAQNSDGLVAGDNIELRIPGPIGAFGISSAGNANRHVRLSGTAVSGEGTIRTNPGILLFADSDTAFGDATRTLNSYRSGTFDFNGHDFAGTLYRYSEDNSRATFINNNLARPATLSGPIDLNLNGNTAFFGGAGDIVHTGTMGYSRSDYTTFGKNGSGTLTLAGETYVWVGNPSYYGGTTVFDYRTHNTVRPLGSNVTLGFGTMRLVGNDGSPTEVDIGTLANDSGLSALETVPGAAGLTLTLGTIANRQHDRAVDLRFGAGTTVALSGDSLANVPSFGGINPNITWDNGRTWAWVDEADATLGPLPASCFSSVQELGKVWDVPAGDSASGNDKIVAMRFADPAGPATLTINNTWEFNAAAEGLGSAVAMLVSPEVGGPVTLDGSGLLRPSGGNTYFSIHNYSTNFPTRISVRLEYNNNNGICVFGPGTTILDNDSNGFFNGPHVYGGTLQYTSIKDNGRNDWNAQRCSLGNAYYSRAMNIGDGAVFEYIGTEPAEGPSSDRTFALYGTGSLKNSGTGVLHFTNTGTFCSAGIQASRLVLDGAGDGIIDGAIAPGDCGWIEKRGTGTWTLTSSAHSGEYPARIYEGTLRLTGALNGGAVVERGGTLAFGEGAVLKRHLECHAGGTVRYEADSDATEHVPALVWGTATLGGALEVSGKIHGSVVVLTAENGIEGAFTTVPDNLVVRIVGNDVVVDAAMPTLLLLR